MKPGYSRKLLYSAIALFLLGEWGGGRGGFLLGLAGFVCLALFCYKYFKSMPSSEAENYGW